MRFHASHFARRRAASAAQYPQLHGYTVASISTAAWLSVLFSDLKVIEATYLDRIDESVSQTGAPSPSQRICSSFLSLCRTSTFHDRCKTVYRLSLGSPSFPALCVLEPCAVLTLQNKDTTGFNPLSRPNFGKFLGENNGLNRPQIGTVAYRLA